MTKLGIGVARKPLPPPLSGILVRDDFPVIDLLTSSRGMISPSTKGFTFTSRAGRCHRPPTCAISITLSEIFMQDAATKRPREQLDGGPDAMVGLALLAATALVSRHDDAGMGLAAVRFRDWGRRCCALHRRRGGMRRTCRGRTWRSFSADRLCAAAAVVLMVPALVLTHLPRHPASCTARPAIRRQERANNPGRSGACARQYGVPKNAPRFFAI